MKRVAGTGAALAAMPPRVRCSWFKAAPSKSFLECRRQNLERFVQRLMECPECAEHDAVSAFIGL